MLKTLSNFVAYRAILPKRAAEGGMRSLRRISTGGAAENLRGALDVSQLAANDVDHKRNETSLNNVTNNSM